MEHTAQDGIGLDNYNLGLATETIKLGGDGPFVTNAQLGWTRHDNSPAAFLHIHTGDTSLYQIMSEFFAKITLAGPRQVYCEIEMTKLPDSLPMAKKRLRNIERRMNPDSIFGDKYKRAINNYIDKGYTRILTSSELQELKPYKLRLVFDAAARIDGVSLNTYFPKRTQE